jgi:hypothetical protein
MNWLPLDGKWTIADDALTFHGEPAKYGEETGLAVGLAMSSNRFTGGWISADVELSNVGPSNSCEIVFYYDSARRWIVSAGIGGPNRMFTIRHFDGKWVYHAATGDRSNLHAGRKYHLAVHVAGSSVRLEVDGVEAARATLPYALQPSQVGLSCLDDAETRITNYRVQPAKGKVFVVMQFSAPYDHLHTEVIKRICEEFDLEAYRADDVFGPGVIIADIARGITEAEVVIAEITPSNPNVYYELGYAHAINKPVILLADRANAKLPFDVAPFRTLFYDNSIAGKRQFEDGLRKHIAAILDRTSSSLSSAG